MPTVGHQLRGAREAQGLSIQQVADVTKIKSEHVRALEEGEYDVFAAPIYIRGFVRTYASLLKLDSLAIMSELDVELARTEKFRDEPSLQGPRQGLMERLMFHVSRQNWRVLLPVLALLFFLLVAIYGFRQWQERRHADPLRDLGPGLHQPANDSSFQTLPLPANAPKK
jgi:cytoskeleton protein RodZ